MPRLPAEPVPERTRDEADSAAVPPVVVGEQPAPPARVVRTDAADGPPGKGAALVGQQVEKKSDGGLLKKLKFSGYVQGRFTALQSSHDGVDEKGKPAVKDGFGVRRGRLKLTHAGEWSSVVISGDFIPKGVTLKDAELRLTEPWTGGKLQLVLGQMLYPFGHEVFLESSRDREMPERARVSRAFLAGERDRGARVEGRFGPVRATVGVFDGNGTDDKSFVGVDNDRAKDVIGRVGVDFKWIAGGVSGWWGSTRDPVTATTHDRNRVGADARVELTLLPLGATALKGEYLQGTTWLKDGVEQFGLSARGFYATLVQHLGAHDALAVRYDWFDPDSSKDALEDARHAGRPASTNAIGTFGAALVHEWDDLLKATVAYEVPLTARAAGMADPADNLLTAQLQAKF